MREQRIYVPYNIGNSNGEKEFPHMYKKGDLHVHTNQTDGTLSPEKMIDKAILRGLDAVAITDHDTIISSHVAFDYALQQALPIEVIKGIEVSSKDGHILALDIDEVVDRGMTLEDTIRMVHRQKGLIVIPHPDLQSASSVQLGLLHELVNSEDSELYLDGIEVLNASEIRIRRFDKLGMLSRRNDNKLKDFLDLHIHNIKLGAFVGSTDAHTRDLGFGISIYNETSILDALRNRSTLPMGAITTLTNDFGQLMQMAYSVLTSHLSGKV